MDDLIRRKDAIDLIENESRKWGDEYGVSDVLCDLADLPSAQPDYTELKQEFLRMASYIDALLECSDKQRETLNGFISRLSEYMPWTEMD